MTKRILIGEDEPAISHSLSLKLKVDGFEPTVVRDGQAVLDALATDHYDLVLLDIIMPVMDGFRVLEQLQGQTGLPKIIVLSNLAQPEDEKRVISLGASGYIVKSNVSLVEIVEQVKKLLS